MQEEERSLESLVIGGVAAAIFLTAVGLIVVTLNLKPGNSGKKTLSGSKSCKTGSSTCIRLMAYYLYFLALCVCPDIRCVKYLQSYTACICGSFLTICFQMCSFIIYYIYSQLACGDVQPNIDCPFFFSSSELSFNLTSRSLTKAAG